MAIDPLLYARSFADVYDDWYGDLDDPSLLVQAMTSSCAPSARVLELGSGTGRLARPLHDAGFAVLALDASISMLSQAAAGPSPLVSDMVALPVRAASVDIVLIAYNTFFNLDSLEQQQRCLAEAARVLRPGGLLVVEAFVAPTSAGAEFGVTIKQHPTVANRRLAIVTGPDTHDRGVIVGSHIELGATTTCRPWRLCYRSPADLDHDAFAAGFVSSRRAEDWAGQPFDENSDRHVSWYERI